MTTLTSSPAGSTGLEGARLRLRPGSSIAAFDDRVVVRRGASALTFRGEAAVTVLPSLLHDLDGSRTVADLTGGNAERASAVATFVEALLSAGLLEPDDSIPAPTPLLELADLLSAAHPGARWSSGIRSGLASRLLDLRLGMAGTGPEADELSTLVARSGLAHPLRLAWPQPDGPPSAPSFDVVLAAPGGHELPALRAFNTWALSHGYTWLPVMPFDGVTTVVGPLVIPRETACLECLIIRQSATLPPESEFEATVTAPRPALFTPAAAIPALAQALLQALRWVLLSDQRVPGTVTFTDPITGAVRTARCLRVPRCPACSPLRAGGVFPWDPT